VIRLLALTLALLLLGGASASAATCPRTTVADLEDEVMCPVCGTTLGLAREAPLAQRERALIVRLAARCESKRQIKTALVAEFGPTVLALPPHRGFDAAAYLVPVAGGLAALLGAVLLLGRWRRRDATAPAPALAPASVADHLDLEAELDRLR
jgi:cytochrome c-type biogenesis protein CcmH/NrfF